MRPARFLAAVALALSAAAASAEERALALGADGALYRVVSGRYGDLFPDAAQASAEHAVLAVDIVRAGAGTRRLLVPGTDDLAVESTPYLVYQSSLDTAVLVWESRLRDIHSSLHLVCLRGGVWSAPIALDADFGSWKSTPRIAITTETYQSENAAGALEAHQRTIIHTLWWEDAGAGERTVYSPVVLIDGEYIGWNPLQVVDELDTAEGPAPFPVAASFYRSPSVAPGGHSNNLILSFVNPRTGRLLKFEVEVLPHALTELAARLRAYLLGLAPVESGSLQTIADKARAHILIGGARRFNEKYLRSLANEVRRRILELGDTTSGIRAIADVSRAHILIGGVEIAQRAFRDSVDGVTSVEVMADDSAQSPLAIVQLRLLASLAAPRIGAGPTKILTSPDGDSTLVAWEEDGEIRYRENYGHEWTVMRALTLGAGLSRERAYEILQRRIGAN